MKRKMTGQLRELAAATLLLLYIASPALAGSVTEPGETVGEPNGAPAPEGLYLVNEVNYGCRNTSPQQTCVLIDIPIIAWSTPWKIFGARLELAVAPTPAAAVGIQNTDYSTGVSNPFVAGVLAWDLGNNWGFSYLLGAYFDVDSAIAFSSGSLNQRFALSYTGNGWDLTANVIWGIQFDPVTSRPQGFPCPVSPKFPSNGCNPDFLNVDLTATKRFGKWELGPVGFYSSDLSTPVPNYRKQSQFATGGLVGYWFGPEESPDVILQAYATTDVYENNYGGAETRVWTRVIIPIPSQTENKSSTLKQ